MPIRIETNIVDIWLEITLFGFDEEGKECILSQDRANILDMFYAIKDRI